MSRKRAKKRALHGVTAVTQPATPPTPSPDTALDVAHVTPAAARASTHGAHDDLVTVATLAASDEIAVQFFSAPPVTHPDEPIVVEPVTDRPARLRAPGAAARRRDLTRYVTGALAVCFMICVAAAVRAATVHAEPNPSAPSYQTASRAPRIEDAPRAAGSAAPPAAVAEPAPPSRPEVAPAPEPAPATRAETVEQAAPEPAAAAVDSRSAADPKAALAAKRDAQRAIDRGDAARAIEAGKRSVDLDPTDAEAWLILGAAHLQRGAYREAREAFTTCTRDATRGPRGECSALLR